MKEKDNIDQELAQWSPLLAKMRKAAKANKPVPAEYFDNLAAQVLQKASEEEASPLSVVHTAKRNRHLLRYSIGAVAAVAALMVGGWWAYPIGASSDDKISLADLEEEEAAAYISSNIGDFELSLMQEAAILDEATIERVDVFPQLDADPVEDYLEELDYKDIKGLF